MTQEQHALSIYGDYNRDDDFAGMRQQDLNLPRLRLMAFNHKLVKERKANAGAWVDTAAEATVIDSGQVGILIPLMFWLEWIEWNPDKAAKQPIIARSSDPLSELAKSAERFEKIRGTDGKEKLKVTEYYSFLVLAPQYFGNYTDMLLLNYSKTGHKVGKAWLNRMRGFKIQEGEQKIGAPMWAVGWEFGSKVEVNDKGEDYYVPVVGSGKLIPQEAVETVKTVALECKARRQLLVEGISNPKDKPEEEPTLVADADL